MKRVIVIDEDELNSLINQAFYAGACAQKTNDFSLGRGDFKSEEYTGARDRARAELKLHHLGKS